MAAAVVSCPLKWKRINLLEAAEICLTNLKDFSLMVVKWTVSSTHFEHKSVHFLTNVSVAKETAVLRRIDQQIQKAQSSFSCSDRRCFNLKFPFKLKMSLLPSRWSSALSSTAADFCSLSRRFSNFLSRMTCPIQTIHFQMKFHSQREITKRYLISERM